MTGQVDCVISANELHALGEPGPAIVVVDCRFNLLNTHAGFHAYLANHIPGARYAHLDKDLAGPSLIGQGRHPLPDMARFRRFLGAIGIDEDTNVVVYDDAGGAIAARLWWLLGYAGHSRRAILDGGIKAWTEAGFPLSTELPVIEAREYPVKESLEPVPVTTAELMAMDLGDTRLIDVRAAQRFTGEQEPIDPVAGHIPGAVNLPFSELLSDHGELLSPQDLRQRLTVLGRVDASAESIAMCGSGVTACLLIAAAERAAMPHPRLYVGSWSEWIQDGSRPVASSDGA